MSLPAHFLEDLRARTPLAALVGRRVRLTRAGRHHKGCCPFHGEKTPSFWVYEDGYHCFGCGAHGDAISFVMHSQGLSFRDAVAQLAGEAGLEVPAPSPEVARAEARATSGRTALEAAQRFYQALLGSSEGQQARDYLRTRGVDAEAIARFGLGWSGAGRGALIAALRRQDLDAGSLEAAGLLRVTETGEARELFYQRVTFPIRDKQGRLVSFGGRSLGTQPPKYVNGPETALFSKRRTLFGLDLAREPVRAGADLLVVEGYMDVIALHQAGFSGAVAPLGTALTPEQLEALWLLSPTPILAFDGDAAGSRAALRALDLALPALTPDRTLRLMQLPSGHDPDSLIKAMGPARFRAEIGGAQSATEALFGLLHARLGSDTPERRARLRARLDDQAGRIGDRALAFEYRRDLRDRFFALQAARRTHGARPKVRFTRPALSAAHARLEQARILTAILLHHPDLCHDLDEAFHRLDLPPWLERLRDAIFTALHGETRLDSAALITQLHASGMTEALARVFAADPLELPACARVETMPAEAEQGWWYHYGLLHGRSQLAAEIAALAAQHLDGDIEARLIALRRAQLALDAEPGGEPGLDD